MQKNIKRIVLGVFVIIGLASCAPPQHIKELWDNKYKPINTLPMYGAPYVKKTEDQKKSDKVFIESVTESEGSREIAAKRFAVSGWAEKQKRNTRVAMMRFNQSWLLDPNYYQPYWGFGAILLTENNPEKASTFFEKALSLIDEDKQKPRLFVDAAKSFAWQASTLKKTDVNQSKTLYKKANALVDKALNLDPKYKRSYSMGGLISYEQGDYQRAWRIVKKSRDSGHYEFDSEFIDKLSKEMNEP